MRHWFAEHFGPAAYIVVGVVSVALLALLTWGLNEGHVSDLRSTAKVRCHRLAEPAARRAA